MAYCTLSDLTTRYGEREILQLSDRSNSGEIDTDVVNGAIVDASALIDGYLADGGYSLPLGSTPQVIRHHCCQIVRYLLYDDLRPETVEDNWQSSIHYLERLADGRSKLSSDLGVTQDSAVSATAAPDRTLVFDSDTWDKLVT